MTPAKQDFWGLWLNDPVIGLLPRSNTMRLPEALQLIDRRGELHTVPGQFAFDGASIPQWAWSIVGSPVDRRFRRPAALHDFYCVTQLIPASEAHRLFYECLRATGVHPFKAWAFHQAVTQHRPRWDLKDAARMSRLVPTGRW